VTPHELPDQLLKCLQEKGLNSTDAISGIQKADLQCIVKYAWTQPDCSARPFMKRRTEYREVYSYDEPVKFKIQIDPSCTQLDKKPENPDKPDKSEGKGKGLKRKKFKGKNSKDKGPSGYFLTLWYCLEYCESVCKQQQQSKYPIGTVSCKMTKNDTNVCDQERTCSCKFNKKPCGPDKVIKFGDMLVEYKTKCLNCFNNKYETKEGESKLSVCVNGTEEPFFVSKPKKAFAVYKKFHKENQESQPE